MATYLEAVEVTFSADERYVQTVIVREKGGDFTRFSFEEVNLNSALDPATFTGR